MAGLQFSSGIDKGFEKDLDKMNTKFNQFGGNVQNKGKKIDATFKTIGKTIGAALTVGAFTAAGKEIVDFSNKLETALVEVATISDEVSQNQEFYRDALISMSTEQDLAASSANQLTEALYDVVSAGYDGAEGLKVLEVAARAGTAGFVETSVAADGITTVLNAWGKSADEAANVSDVFFKTVEKGKTTFPELGANIAKVAPLAASMGVSFEEVSGAIASVTKQGTKTPEALTQIRAAMVSMNKVLGDGWSASMSLQEGLSEIAKQAGGSQNELKKLLGTDEAVLAVLALTGENAIGAAADLAEMDNALGATATAADKVVMTTAHQLKALKNNILAALEPLSGEASSMLANLAHLLNNAFESGDIEKYGKIVAQLIKVFAVYKVATIAQNQIQKLTIAQNKVQALTGVKVAKSTLLMSRANKGLSKSFKSLSNAFKTNPLGLIATGLALAYPLITKFIDKQKELNKIQNISVDSVNKYSASLEVEKGKLNGLFDQLKKTNPETEERKKLIEELKRINPEYTSLIDLETASEVELELARKNSNDELERKIALGAKELATSNIDEQLKVQIEELRQYEGELKRLNKILENQQKDRGTSTYRGGSGVAADLIKDQEKAISKIKQNVEALKAERDKISEYYDDILNPKVPKTPDEIEVAKLKATKELAKKLEIEAAKGAKLAEQNRLKAISELELSNQKETNLILQQFGSTEQTQEEHLDNLLTQQLNYLNELRKLTVDKLELAKIDEAIIQGRITKSTLPSIGGSSTVKSPTKLTVKPRSTPNNDNVNASWKDTLEIMNGVNELIKDTIGSFDGLDEKTKLVASSSLQAAGGLVNMVQGIQAAGAAVTALEKASAVLAIISTALQLISVVSNLFKADAEARSEAIVDELEKVQAVNVALIEQNALYEEGNRLFSDDRWGTALAGLDAYNEALELQGDLEKDAQNIGAIVKSGLRWENGGFRIGNEYERISTLYPELIDSAGHYDSAILQLILDTEDLTDADRVRLENLLEANELAKDSFAQFSDYLSGVFDGLGDSAAEAFQMMYESGNDAMTSLQGSFSDMVESFSRDAIKMVYIQPLLDDLNNTVVELGKSSNLSPEAIQEGVIDALGVFYKGLEGSQPKIIEAYEAADKLAADFGFEDAFNGDNGSGNPLARSGQVTATISEEMGGMMVGRLGAMMISNQEIADNTDDIRTFATRKLELMKKIKLNTDFLPQIAENTKKTYEKLESV